MPQNVLESLEHLCIRTIANNWERLKTYSFGDSDNEFSNFIRCLPEAILTQIEERLTLSRHKPLNFRDYQLLVCRPVTALNLKRFFLSKSETAQAVQLFVRQWSRGVRDVAFGGDFVRNAISFENVCLTEQTDRLPKYSNALDILLRSVPNVTRLCFENSNCQNWMLRVVAKHCLHLKELNVAHCEEVTDVGIAALCDADNHIEAEFDLHKISLFGTNTTKQSIVLLLVRFPNLRLCSHPELLLAVQFLYAEDCSGQSPTDFSLLPLLENLACSNDSLTILCENQSFCNNLLCLELLELSPNTELNFLSNLPNLQSLTLGCNNFYKGCDLNLSSLAIDCPKLKYLSLKLNGRLRFSQSVPGTAFKSLKTVIVDGLKPESLSTSDAFKLLSRCTCVKKLSLSRCPWLSDKILEDILRLNPLRNARELKLLKTKLSVDGLSRILELKNNLFVFSLSSLLIGSKHQSYFTDYIRRKNWNLIFKLYTN